MFGFNTADEADLELLRGCTRPRTVVLDTEHHLRLAPALSDCVVHDRQDASPG
jgi:hypothetical protein